MEETPVTLDSIGEGIAIELFDIELERVLKNIADVNTDPDGAREITLKFRIMPKQDRALGEVRITATSKLAGAKPRAALLYVVRRGGQISAVESNPKQLSIPGDIVPIGERRT